MATVRGTQGQTLAFDTETTLGTAVGSPTDLRYESLTFPDQEYTAVDNRPRGRENWANNSDRPILFRQAQEGAISMECMCRVNASNYDPLTKAATVGGFGAASAVDTTCTITAGTIDTVSNGATPGQAYLALLDSGIYMPVLPTETESGAAVDITMATNGDATAGNLCHRMRTIYPKNIALSTYGNFEWSTRAENTSGDDCSWQASGCALSGISGISFEPNKPVKYSFTYSAAQVDKTTTALGAESLAFGEKVPVIDSNFEFGYADAPTNDTWALTRAVSNIIKADIELNHTIVPIPSLGGAANIGGIQGYYAVPGVPRISVTMIFNEDLWDQWSGTNTYKYMHFVQPTTDVGATPTPAFGWWFPRCYQAAPPTKDSTGDYYTMTVTYDAYSAGFESTTTNNDISMAPYFYASGGYYVAV